MFSKVKPWWALDSQHLPGIKYNFVDPLKNMLEPNHQNAGENHFDGYCKLYILDWKFSICI